MKIEINMLLKPNIAWIVEEDNDDSLEEVLMGENNLETIHSKGGKEHKKLLNIDWWILKVSKKSIKLCLCTWFCEML